jgi:hypothetical protein
MAIKPFPKELYRGNSVCTTFSTSIEEDEVEQSYIFKVGDVLELGIKEKVKDDENYILHKKFRVTEETDALQIYLSPEETKDIPEELNAILEFKLIYNNGASVKTVYQKKIKLKGVVIDE